MASSVGDNLVLKYLTNQEMYSLNINCQENTFAGIERKSDFC